MGLKFRSARESPTNRGDGRTDLTDAVNGFRLTYEGFDPDEGLREALTSTGNGYLCSRRRASGRTPTGCITPARTRMGSTTGRPPSGRAAGAQRGSRQPSQLAGAQGADRGRGCISLADVELLDYRHSLDIRNALVMRELRFRDRSPVRRALRSRRFVSMAAPHQAGIEWTLTAENWSGRVEVDLRARRPRDQQRRRPLSAARGPAPRSGLAADVRA